MHIRYSLYGASMESENRHAQEVMKDLGIEYQHATPQSIADSWWFWNCVNVPEDIPGYISELKVDPLECIGNGLSESDAKTIKARELELSQ